MMQTPQILVLAHLIIYFGIILGLRTWLFYKKTGINPLNNFGKNKRRLHETVLLANLFLLQVIVLVYCFIPSLYKYLLPLHSLDQSVPDIISAIVSIIGFVLTWTAQAQMQHSWRFGIDDMRTAPLVTTGLFRYSRNPTYFGLFLAFVGFVLIIPSVASLLFFITMAFAVQEKVRHEERHLMQLYPEEFQAYRRKVRRWV